MPGVTKCFAPHWQNNAMLHNERPAGVTVHRIDVTGSTTQEGDVYENTCGGITDFYNTHKHGIAATGGGMPFSVLIDAEGNVTQAVPLDRQTPHAWQLNPTHCGVACTGDFRKTPMPAAQMGALIGVCAYMARYAGFEASAVLGQTESPLGTKHSDLDSPGAQVDLARLRQDIAAMMAGGLRTTPAYDFTWTSDELNDRPVGREPPCDLMWA